MAFEMPGMCGVKTSKAKPRTEARISRINAKCSFATTTELDLRHYLFGHGLVFTGRFNRLNYAYGVNATLLEMRHGI